jgi:hypothetical protein
VSGIIQVGLEVLGPFNAIRCGQLLVTDSEPRRPSLAALAVGWDIV